MSKVLISVLLLLGVGCKPAPAKCAPRPSRGAIVIMECR